MPTDQASNQVVDFFNSIPLITRVLFISAIVIPLISKFLIAPVHFVLIWPLVLQKLQLWRLLSCFFISPLGFDFVMQLFFLYQYSSALEEGHFKEKTADYAFMITFFMALSWIAGYFFQLLVLRDPLFFALIYVWSRFYESQTVGFMFGITFKAIYLPWVLVLWSFLLSGNVPLPSLLGIAIGHVYYYLKSEYPLTHQGRSILNTPFIFHWLLPASRASSSNSNSQANERPHVWHSRGRRLGS